MDGVGRSGVTHRSRGAEARRANASEKRRSLVPAERGGGAGGASAGREPARGDAKTRGVRGGRDGGHGRGVERVSGVPVRGAGTSARGARGEDDLKSKQGGPNQPPDAHAQSRDCLRVEKSALFSRFANAALRQHRFSPRVCSPRARLFGMWPPTRRSARYFARAAAPESIAASRRAPRTPARAVRASAPRRCCPGAPPRPRTLARLARIGGASSERAPPADPRTRRGLAGEPSARARHGDGGAVPRGAGRGAGGAERGGAARGGADADRGASRRSAPRNIGAAEPAGARLGARRSAQP